MNKKGRAGKMGLTLVEVEELSKVLRPMIREECRGVLDERLSCLGELGERVASLEGARGERKKRVLSRKDRAMLGMAIVGLITAIVKLWTMGSGRVEVKGTEKGLKDETGIITNFHDNVDG